MFGRYASTQVCLGLRACRLEVVLYSESLMKDQPNGRLHGFLKQKQIFFSFLRTFFHVNKLVTKDDPSPKTTVAGFVGSS